MSDISTINMCYCVRCILTVVQHVAQAVLASMFPAGGSCRSVFKKVCYSSCDLCPLLSSNTCCTLPFWFLALGSTSPLLFLWMYEVMKQQWSLSYCLIYSITVIAIFIHSMNCIIDFHALSTWHSLCVERFPDIQVKGFLLYRVKDKNINSSCFDLKFQNVCHLVVWPSFTVEIHVMQSLTLEDFCRRIDVCVLNLNLILKRGQTYKITVLKHHCVFRGRSKKWHENG